MKELGRASSPASRRRCAATSPTAHPEDVLLLALGGAVEHVGRDGEAFASWEDTEPTVAAGAAAAADEPVKGA